MAAKRIRPIGGQQDFGFLKTDSGPKPETGQSTPLFPEVPDKAEASGLDFSSVEASSGLFPAVSDAENIEDAETTDMTSEVDDEQAVEDVPLPPADIELSMDEISTTELTEATETDIETDSEPDIDPDDSNEAATFDEQDEEPVEESATENITVSSEATVSASAPVNVTAASVTSSVASSVRAAARAPATAGASTQAAASRSDKKPDSSASSDHVSRKLFVSVAGYAIALTLLLLGLLVTGCLALSSNHVLESLPDLRPLKPNEFRPVPDGTDLPDGHVMRIGESRRFGDVVVTPVRLSMEPLKFQSYNTGVPEDKLTTKPVLRLWLTLENVGDYAFPPFDAGLMSNRTPPDTQDEATMANSFLTVGVPSGEKSSTRVLNFLQTMDNYFVITGQDCGKVLVPNESLTTFVASNEEINGLKTEDGTSFVWRIQFRKGVNTSSGNGVTTLIDVKFSGADLANAG
ncbi:MAG TPA: hypothetical protein PLY87_19705 [Planctomycetaceae bacterium]|nr:hypothetical protein [Planctomycetaceae bacterium]HQZ67330.1 hypothetical protein [Planctomycetaceae bacterium]